MFPPASHAVHRSLPPPAPGEVSPPSPQAARQLPTPQPWSFPRPPAASTPGTAGACAPPDSAATPAPLGLNPRPFGRATPCLLPQLGSDTRARVRTPRHLLSVSADCAALGALGFREPLVSSDDNLKVVVRVRPMSERELDAGAPADMHPDGSNQLVNGTRLPDLSMLEAAVLVGAFTAYSKCKHGQQSTDTREATVASRWLATPQTCVMYDTKVTVSLSPLWPRKTVYAHGACFKTLGLGSIPPSTLQFNIFRRCGARRRPEVPGAAEPAGAQGAAASRATGVHVRHGGRRGR